MSLKFFQPYALLNATEKVRQCHQNASRKQQPDLPENELIALLQRIEQTPSNECALDSLADDLSARQIQSLAAYIPGKVYGDKYDIHKVIYVVSHCMTPRIFGHLWTGWQKFPDNEDLLAMLADSAVLTLGSPENFPLSSEKLESWVAASQDRSLISVVCCQYVQKLPAVPLESVSKGRCAPSWRKSLFYRKWAASAFLPDETNLFYRCFIYYLAQANIDEMEEVGDESMAALFSRATNSSGIRSAMIHLLSQKTTQLKQFGGTASYFGLSRTFEVIQKKFGVPDRWRIT